MTDCRRFEEALRRENPDAWRKLEPHARECGQCRAGLEVWGGLGEAARGLQKEWESPGLWPRIENAIASQSESRPAAPAAPFVARPARWPWLPLAAAAALFVVATVGLQVFRPRLGERELLNVRSYRDPLLTEQAFTDVEKSERRYVASIEQLSRLAEPKLKEAATPLLVSYREKILLLDGAIADLRGQLDQNRFNTHLRRELLAMYQEKQRTLQRVIQEDKS